MSIKLPFYILTLLVIGMFWISCEEELTNSVEIFANLPSGDKTAMEYYDVSPKSLELKAIAKMFGGVTKDVTLESTWNISNPDIGIIDSKGIFSTRSQGRGEITATYEGITSVPLPIYVGAIREKTIFASKGKSPKKLQGKAISDEKAATRGPSDRISNSNSA